VKLGGADVSSSTQFEGRTAEEAVARARAALGDAGAVRCWKTRRGGVGGFFAREVFVASLTPPPGSESPRGKASRAEPARVSDGTTSAVPDLEAVDDSVSAGDHLSGLVEATSDPLSLHSLSIPADAFDQVLAEAQAALSREPDADAISAPDVPAPPPEPEPVVAQDGTAAHDAVVGDDDAENRAAGEADPDAGVDRSDTRVAAPERPQPHGSRRPPAGVKRGARPKPATPPEPSPVRPAPVAGPKRSTRPARIPDLGPGLRGLGVPSSYLPPGRRPSLDALADAMGTLPVPPALPSHAGAVVAVAGAGNDLARTVALVTTELALGPRDVLQLDACAAAAGEERAGRANRADRAEAADVRLSRQLDRRRAQGSSLVVAVEVGPGMPMHDDVRRLLDRAAPDYLLAAVGAGCKRVDVEHWLCDMPAADALALWDLDRTRTPAELLGVRPIAYVDGEPSSTLDWTLLLAGRAASPRR
jgi:hypothetical protein